MYLRCDFYTDHYLEGEINENGYLEIDISNGDFHNSYRASIQLSKESAVELARQLLNSLKDIKKEKIPPLA